MTKVHYTYCSIIRLILYSIHIYLPTPHSYSYSYLLMLILLLINITYSYSHFFQSCFFETGMVWELRENVRESLSLGRLLPQLSEAVEKKTTELLKQMQLGGRGKVSLLSE